MAEQESVHPSMTITLPETTNTLAFAENIQRQLITSYLFSGKMPTDTKEQALLIKLLGDMSKQELTKMRLDIDKQGVSANEQLAREIAKFAAGLGGGNPFEDKSAAPNPEKAPTPDLTQLPNLDIPEGEMDLTPRS
nr:MAG: hypothetical protein [Bacteriophage sp.]